VCAVIEQVLVLSLVCGLMMIALSLTGAPIFGVGCILVGIAAGGAMVYFARRTP
jgi:hypothetical protein